MDGQFDGLRGDLATLGITLNTASNDEHVPEIECHIRTLKERVRRAYTMLPFQRIPTRFIIDILLCVLAQQLSCRWGNI